jgi:hypothetical protein
LNRQVKRFELNHYYGGLNMIWLVTRGVWTTSVSMREYLSFGAKYPFKSGLLVRPKIFLKYIVIRLRLGPYFNHSKLRTTEKKTRL